MTAKTMAAVLAEHQLSIVWESGDEKGITCMCGVDVPTEIERNEIDTRDHGAIRRFTGRGHLPMDSDGTPRVRTSSPGRVVSRSVRDPDYRQPAAGTVCGWWVGPVWKLDGETCVCIKPRGHGETEGHECSCGSWFAGCGHPPIN